MKRTLTVFLGLLLLAFPNYVKSQDLADYTWETNADNTITITAYNGLGGAVAIPSSISALRVTGIGNGQAAVFSENLSSVTIPNSVTTIAPSAFEFCTGLTAVTIPDSVNSIGAAAFLACSALPGVSIPASVTNIGVEAFTYCSSMTSITVDPSNPSYSSAGGVLFNKNQTTLVEFPGGVGGEYTIPGTVTDIAQNSFQNCGDLTSVTIPDNVTTIEEEAFQACTGLGSITIPDSVTTIGYAAFWRCYGIATIYIGHGVATIEEEAFFSCVALTSVYFTGNAPFGDSTVFSEDGGTVYYLQDTTGWEPTFGGLPTAPWIPGGLAVTITPPQAVSDGAQWQVDNGSWQNSGQIVANLAAGNHTVSFSTISGWTTPADQTIYINPTGFATATGTYVSTTPSGSLQVTISPAAVITAGAQWQVDGGAAQDSGAIVNYFSPGQHTVSFTIIAGWMTPSNQTVTITNGATTIVTGIYNLAALQPFAVLYSFTTTSVGVDGTNGDGASPYGPLILSEGTLYGTTEGGGTGGYGTVFATDTNGAGFTNLHNFSPINGYDNSDGANPQSSLILSDNTLYGTCKEGGGGYGTVFALGTEGTTFTNLHNFDFYDGFSPITPLVLSGRTLYGTASGGGGTTFNGTVFAVNIDGTGFSNLYNFSGGSDGSDLRSGLTLSGQTLYGTAGTGGAGGSGTVFKVNIDGTAFTVLHTFAAAQGDYGTNSDGSFPQGALALSSNTLYGTAYFGGNGGWGTIFAVNTDGTGFTNLHTFGYSDGSHPLGLVLSSNTLYGATQQGGSWGAGAVFAINTDGTGFSTLYNFTPGQPYTGAYPNGETPLAGVVASDGMLYGTTAGGGSYSDGIVFSLSPALISARGSLAVTINPTGAITNGAQWQVDSGPLENSGAIVSNLTIGTHTVTFNSLNGWTTPPSQTVAILENQTVTTTGTYQAQPGSLEVMIYPSSAINAGAMWSVDGAAFQGSGAIVTNLQPGDHTVSFTSISGWNTPLNQTVTITTGVTTMASGIYTPSNVLPDTLILITNGWGTIQHTAWPKSLVIGNKYKVTAVPKAKNVFSDWVGGTTQPYSVLSSSASYTFTMEPNLLLEANFETNFFLAAQGAYRGLFAPTSSARQQANSGSFLFSVTSSGAVSGNLDLGGQTVPLSGKFDLGGAASIISKRHGEPSLTTALQLDFADQSASGTVSDGTFTAELNGFRDVFGRSDKATEFEGQYTFVIPGTTNPTVGPFGTSYGAVKVSSSGTITLAGSLSDGTAISQSSVVSQEGNWPLYVNLYGGKGSLWGWNYFTNQTLSAPSSLSWINTGNSSKTALYRSGFTNQQATLTGGIYVPDQTLPDDLNATLEGGNLLFAISNGVTISASDKIALTNALDETNKLKLTISKSTGVISGSFANPANPKQTIKVNGAILQGQTNAQGYFLGTNQSGTFLLEYP